MEPAPEPLVRAWEAEAMWVTLQKGNWETVMDRSSILLRGKKTEAGDISDGIVNPQEGNLWDPLCPYR